MALGAILGNPSNPLECLQSSLGEMGFMNRAGFAGGRFV